MFLLKRRDTYGFTPFHFIVEEGQIEHIKFVYNFIREIIPDRDCSEKYIDMFQQIIVDPLNLRSLIL